MSNHLTVIVLSGCFFSACTSVQPEGTSEFIDSWSESASNSAVSYWYVGEDQGHHVIVEKWPTKSVTYHVDTSQVRIVGVYGIFSDREEVSLNLKQENIEIVDNASRR
jgi:hypothetical protein